MADTKSKRGTSRKSTGTRKPARRSQTKSSRRAADHRTRNIAIGATTAVAALASAVGAALHFGLFDRLLAGDVGHDAPDLDEDTPRPGAHDRAPEHFRPDPTAAVPASDREALRPATGPSPTLSEDRGTMNSTTAPGNG